MSMTQASSRYFEQVAGQWDSLRQGYFNESLRATAIAKAYLRDGMRVADVGGGTGFMSAGLAPQVAKVHLIDGSAAMLDVARQNLAAFSNIEYHLAEGSALPLPDASLDAVFANMYLHHCPDPLAAIREMSRILRPGGRLVITDMDAHNYAWLKDEMADEWLGFERGQVKNWLREAGLVNRIVSDSQESCCAVSTNALLQDEAGREARISVFLAVGSKAVEGVHEAVRQDYGALAAGRGGCCTPASTSSPVLETSCCAPVVSLAPQNAGCGCGCGPQDAPAVDIFDPAYTPQQLKAAPEEAAGFSLGCGNPTAFAGLRPGETVLDIGSGGGLDSLLAAQAVGPQGRVIGVDMTPAMLERARQAAQRAGVSWVEFRQGQAESLPVEPDSMDVVLSNCVINLTLDKGLVFEEIFRVLRPGGRLEIADIVSDGSLPVDMTSWAGCVSGALPEGEYVDLVRQAGFEKLSLKRSPSAEVHGGVKVFSLALSAQKPTVQA